MTDVVNHATGGKKRSSAPSAQMSKGPWTEEEDRKVVELVGKYGPKKWSQIASELPGSGECCCFLLNLRGGGAMLFPCYAIIFLTIT